MSLNENYGETLEECEECGCECALCRDAGCANCDCCDQNADDDEEG